MNNNKSNIKIKAGVLCIVWLLLAVSFSGFVLAGVVTNTDVSTTTTDSDMVINYQDGTIKFLSQFMVNGTTPRWINNSYDNKDTLIRNSNGKYWSATWANIQLAIDDVNGSGTAWLPEGKMTGSTTIEINEEVSLIGAVFPGNNEGATDTNGTVLEYTGSGDVIYVDGTNNYVDGMEIKNLYIKANNCTAINCTATAPNVITRSYIHNIRIDNPYIGIKLHGLSGGSAEVFRNRVENIYIKNIGEGSYGIYAKQGTYNTFKNLEIVDCDDNSYVIYNTMSNTDWSSISCDGHIRNNGQNTVWTAIKIETVPTICPDDCAFFAAGQGTSIDTLSFINCDITTGLSTANGYHLIRNVRAYGTDYPTYTFNPGAASNGTAISIYGESTYWSHLDHANHRDWTFIDVDDRYWFSDKQSNVTSQYIPCGTEASVYSSPSDGAMMFVEGNRTLAVYHGGNWWYYQAIGE